MLKFHKRKEGVTVYLCSNEEIRQKIQLLNKTNKKNSLEFISPKEVKKDLLLKNFTELKNKLLNGIYLSNNKKELLYSPPFIIKILIDEQYEKNLYKLDLSTNIDINLYIVHTEEELKEVVSYFVDNPDILETYQDMETSINVWLETQEDFLEEE